MSDLKLARPDHPVHDFIKQRWSPYGFAERTVSDDDLRSVLEAARWAASSYNEQPWRYIMARREDSASFERVLSCLIDANQVWARNAPVLLLGVYATHFERNGKPNKAAQHDLGLAAANLTFEATARGLVVHQMIGIVPDRAREVFGIPEGFAPHTALAIGYAGTPGDAPEAVRARDEAPRSRRPLRDTVFGDAWGEPFFG
jgi:nitroreductase